MELAPLRYAAHNLTKWPYCTFRNELHCTWTIPLISFQRDEKITLVLLDHSGGPGNAVILEHRALPAQHVGHIQTMKLCRIYDR
jgi:hypothetical protein